MACTLKPLHPDLSQPVTPSTQLLQPPRTIIPALFEQVILRTQSPDVLITWNSVTL